MILRKKNNSHTIKLVKMWVVLKHDTGNTYQQSTYSLKIDLNFCKSICKNKSWFTMVAASNVKLASMPKYNKDLHSEIVYFEF